MRIQMVGQLGQHSLEARRIDTDEQVVDGFGADGLKEKLDKKH